MPSVAGSSPRVFIHVGVPKSGTSFIQATLRQNKAALLEHGFLYPSQHGYDMFHAALDVTGNHEHWRLSRESVAGSWEQMCKRALAFDGTSVISSEFLCGARPAQIRRALADLEGAEVHVVVTGRDMARQVPAEWQEGIKHGRAVTFAEFQQRILDPERRHQHARRFWHYQDLPRVLARWAAEVSDERVHLVTCPHPGAAHALLWQRFCSVVGLDPAVAELPPPGLNASLGVTEVEVLRQVNRAVRRTEDPSMYVRLVKHDLVRGVLRHHSSPRASTPEELLPVLRDLAKQWRAEIERHDYDIVGDLAELDPVESKGAAVNPDKVPMRKVVGVSSDAIVHLLEEVHRLREENHALRAQSAARRSLVRRAASRLRRTLRR